MGEIQMTSGAVLGIFEEAGVAVLTLTEGVDEAEFRNSRITRAEVVRQLVIIANCASEMDPVLRAALAEVDWPTWDVLGPLLRSPRSASQDEAIWFAIASSVPALLLWLRVYRKHQPELFRMTLTPIRSPR